MIRPTLACNNDEPHEAHNWFFEVLRRHWRFCPGIDIVKPDMDGMYWCPTHDPTVAHVEVLSFNDDPPVLGVAWPKPRIRMNVTKPERHT